MSVSAAHAQQFDLAFGVGTVTGQSASDAFNDIQNHTPQSIGGGGYPAFSGDFLFIKKYFGVGGEVAWRGHQNVDIFFNPYRPIFYDFNAVYGPPLGKKAQADHLQQRGIQIFAAVVAHKTLFGCIPGLSHNFCMDSIRRRVKLRRARW